MLGYGSQFRLLRPPLHLGPTCLSHLSAELLVTCWVCPCCTASCDPPHSFSWTMPRASCLTSLMWILRVWSRCSVTVRILLVASDGLKIPTKVVYSKKGIYWLNWIAQGEISGEAWRDLKGGTWDLLLSPSLAPLLGLLLHCLWELEKVPFS